MRRVGREVRAARPYCQALKAKRRCHRAPSCTPSATARSAATRVRHRPSPCRRAAHVAAAPSAATRALWRSRPHPTASPPRRRRRATASAAPRSATAARLRHAQRQTALARAALHACTCVMLARRSARRAWIHTVTAWVTAYGCSLISSQRGGGGGSVACLAYVPKEGVGAPREPQQAQPARRLAPPPRCHRARSPQRPRRQPRHRVVPRRPPGHHAGRPRALRYIRRHAAAPMAERTRAVEPSARSVHLGQHRVGR